PEAIARVRAEAWPDPANPDELHDALAWLGFLDAGEVQPGWRDWYAQLARERRVAVVIPAPKAVMAGLDPAIHEPDALSSGSEETWITGSSPVMTIFRPGQESRAELWIAVERLPQFRVLWPNAKLDPSISAPEPHAAREWSREEALIEILRGRLEGLGPVTEAALAAPLGIEPREISAARLDSYERSWLDDQCLAGRIAWARLRPRNGGERSASPVRTTPIALLARRHAGLWTSLSAVEEPVRPSSRAQTVVDFIRQ